MQTKLTLRLDRCVIDKAKHYARQLLSATTLPFRDYEDAVLHEAARISGVDAIVTRNLADFTQAQLPIYDPPTLLALFQAKDEPKP